MNYGEEIKKLFPETEITTQTNKPMLIVKKQDFLDIAKKIKEMGFEHLSLITGIDYVEWFEVIYNFFSYSHKENLAIKVKLDHDSPEIDSLISIWKSADWLERETYDLVGIKFVGHPNLKRILLPEGWNGHPLRKDYDMKTEQFVIIGEDGEDVVNTDGAGLLRGK